MSSWDVPRAYDSISKTDTKLSWMGLGAYDSISKTDTKLSWMGRYSATSHGAILTPTTGYEFFGILLVALSHTKAEENNILLPGLPMKLIFTHDPWLTL